MACPFNVNEISEMVYNYGCLPTPSQILDFKLQNNWNWECHEGTGKVCGGFVAVCKDKNLDYRSGNLLGSGYYLQTGKLRERRPDLTN